MITSCDEAIGRLRSAPGLSICPRPLLVLPLLRTGCLTAVLGVEAPDAGWADEFGTAFHTLEAATGTRDHTATGPGVDEVLRRLRDGARPWPGGDLALLSYVTVQPRWRTALEALGTRLLEPPHQPSLPVMGDKIAQRAWLRSLGAATPPDAVVDTLDHRALARRFGERYVVQTPRGSGGHGTHLVTREEDLPRAGTTGQGTHGPAAQETGPWLVSGYVEGTPVNVHGLVSADGTVRVLRPSVQLTRVEGVGAAFGAYSGCDFGAPALLAPRALERATGLTRQIGAALARLGYRGLFGADFVLDDGDRALLLELNCRMQGSTWLLGELELAEHALPAALRHLLERHGHPTGGEPRTDPAGAAQLVVRHTGSPARVRTAPTGGLHRLKDGLLQRCGAGFGLLECGPDDVALLQLPSPGTLLHPGVPLARIVARHPLTTPDGTALTPYARQLVDALRTGFTLEPARPADPAETAGAAEAARTAGAALPC
ncbi:ATP-grasp domain-containing protein [Kitasatospora sp. NPDC056446]|uniref:ATP-grasp domain-containing protein n=1 Tax=Kitasatospora sp. NPDC056446 TaxID=3345819 RepID=UPI0036871B15